MSVDRPLDPPDGVAIIGMAGRFPGARSVDELWRNLCDGVDAITDFSDADLHAAGVPASALADPAYVKAGPVLDDVEQFDADFFGISAHEAELTDPQQRLFLECAWEALERAGYDPDRIDGRVGVFAGAGLNTYLLQLAAARDILNSPDAFQAILANAADHLATHVSYKLNLRGPSLSVQTACSTSLVAVHLAFQSLMSGESDVALAGGVSVSVPQRAGYHYQEGMILSPDGRCRAFDADAAGTVGGSGLGLVVLKRVADAVADGDTIYAVIRGSAINNDGSAKVGYSAPSVEGQAEVIAEALALAGVEADTIGYVEAHGTGTPLGDPIEVAALRRVFGPGRGSQTCKLGSLKTNVGHLDAAAGVAGLIKTALALHHQQIPPTLHFRQAHPQLELDQTPFYVNASLEPWPIAAMPRRAGVSSFGIGGTNAHVVLEEAPAGVPARVSGEPMPSVLVLSARTPTALDAASDRLADHLLASPDLDLADAAYTLQLGRRAFPYRRVVIADDAEAAAQALKSLDPKRVWSGESGGDAPSVAYLFPGQGAQYVGMARGLYESLPVFRATVDRCAERLRPCLGLDLRTVLFPASADADAARLQLTQTALAQPVLFTIELALAHQWASFGVGPTAVLGHSLGEYVAACLAGVFSEDDALALVAERGRLMQSCPPGAMLSVPLPEDDMAQYLDGEVALAAVNGPAQCVVGGPADAIERLAAELRSRGVTVRRLVTSHAFHTPLMEPAVSTFATRVAQTTRHVPTLPWVSTVTGTWIGEDEVTSPEYWARQIRRPVRFGAAVKTLLDDPARLLLEVGPGRTLASLARLQVPERRADGQPDVPIVGSVRHPDDTTPDLDVLLGGLGRLWLAGVSVDWTALHDGTPRKRVPLPTYPFERRRFWIDGQTSTTEPSTERDGGNPATRASAAAPGRYGRPNLATPYVAPRTELEEIIAGLWQDVLGLANVGVHDDFFELGGHSLLAIQLLTRLRDSFALDLPILTIFEAPTIAALSDTIEERLVEQIESLSDNEAERLVPASIP
jgi:phthiocerol/phenolphthiocerol synthesis type-I polyketide synthase E